MSKEILYDLGPAGRVKSAGVSFEPLMEIAGSFDVHPSPGMAAEITDTFRTLRKNPPTEIRDRFFPYYRATVRQMTKTGHALLRPILKTDQGQGCFLPFAFGLDGTRSFERAREIPYFIFESYFNDQLKEHKYPSAVISALEELDGLFSHGNFDEARLAYERLELACDENGIHLKRQASVGRDGLFFIRPAIAKEPIRLSSDVQARAAREIEIQASVFRDSMEDARRIIARKHDISIKNEQADFPLYFQVDMQIFPDGTMMLDQVHMPDVGLFLSGLNSNENAAISSVQEHMKPVKEAVIASIAEELRNRGTDTLHLITRDEVLSAKEDVLEQLEMSVISQSLATYGIRTKSGTIADALRLEKTDVALLLNINSKSPAFEQLLVARITRPTAAMFPDPLIIGMLCGYRGYETKIMTQEDITNMHAILGETETTPERTYRQMMALDHQLDRLGLQGYVFHVQLANQPTPIACLRHDVRSFQMAFKEVQPEDTMRIFTIPIDANRAVLFDEHHRPLYSVFRFMAVRRHL
ncbi:MAG: hypothetical protein NTY06_00460 [Candidatus Gottesmanbacteria bacterium]|nr:hypothetical protein [Candidatus Gottesmanbacteria bacterium]